jgi:signal transduction histidine kinase/ligand-binding sensor domain-containing protein
VARALDPDLPLGACNVAVWGARNGLPSSYVRAISQTADGYLWIAGYGGVGRYDGARVVTLPEPEAVPRIYDTQSLKVDHRGTLWVIPSKGTPLCVRDAVVRACLGPGIHLPPGERVVDAQPDPDGTAWLATRRRLLHYLPDPPRLVTVPAPPLGRLGLVHRDRRGRLWVGTDTGLYRAQHDGTLALASTDAWIRDPISDFFETPQGRLWFLLDRGLLRVDGDEMRLLARRDGRGFDRPGQVIEDRDGNVWIGNRSGLTRFRHGEWVTFTTRDGLPDDNVTALHEDLEGSLWVGTRNGGVAQFTDRVVATRADWPTDNRISTICQDHTGAYWLGSRQGLLRWKGREERVYTTRDGLPDNQVTAVAPGQGDEVWVGTMNGIARAREGRIDVLDRVPGSVDAIAVDGEEIWFGHEATLLHVAGGRIEEVARAQQGYIRAIERDGVRQIWVATTDELLRLAGGRLVPVELPQRQPIRALHRDREGQLWLTAGTDIARLSPGPIRFLGAAIALGGRQLFQITDDDRGFMWIGSSRGLLRLPKARMVAAADGVRTSIDPLSLDTDDRRRDVTANNTHHPGVWRDSTGRLWFATDQGALMIDPARLRVNARPPTVRIDEATGNARPLLRGVRNELPPGPGNLQFRFSAVTLLEPHKSLHRYRLEGFDDGWVDAGARRAAYYTNIPPGTYRFRVQGSNADGVWNEAGDVIELRLLPHLYQTRWFYGTSALAAIASLVLVWRQRVSRLRREYLTTLAERNRVARELHDTLLQGMSAVGLKLRALRRQVDAPAVARELAEIGLLVTTALQETRRFLGDLRGQNGTGDLAVALRRVAGRLTEGRPIVCAVVVAGEAAPLHDEVKSDLFRIAQEAIHNAVKHASPSRIDVKLRYAPEAMLLTIADDGCGFDQSAAVGATEGHFGLVGMRERGTRLGHIRITSHPGHGTTIVVTVPFERTERDV